MISAVESETWGLKSLDRYICRKGILRSYNNSPKYGMLAEGIFAVDLSFALFAYCDPCSELNSPKHDMLAEGCFAADFSCGLFAYYKVFRS